MARGLLRIAAGLAAAASLSLTPLAVQAGGNGCGCEGPSSTVYHVHSRCHHHCRSCPPVGMVVQSAPVMPMMMAPVMAMPVQAVMAQPAAIQYSAPPQQSSLTQAQLTRALALLAADNQPAVTAGCEATSDKISALEQRVANLEQSTQKIFDVMQKIEQKMK